MIPAILKLFQKQPPADPTALAQAKRSMEKQLRQGGMSIKEAKTRVSKHFESRCN